MAVLENDALVSQAKQDRRLARRNAVRTQAVHHENQVESGFRRRLRERRMQNAKRENENQGGQRDQPYLVVFFHALPPVILHRFFLGFKREGVDVRSWPYDCYCVFQTSCARFSSFPLRGHTVTYFASKPPFHYRIHPSRNTIILLVCLVRIGARLALRDPAPPV